ncbi:FAD binding domain-containing protein [Sinorhizobium meliloti]|uniref:FAD binding domain-containing protein n=1 Tax=Rhizobium meliloti TaxID=382 RepID=UPI000B49B5C2|nr:xanthine dehydrogenase family protein subunit M [Sinorhizobium meliloti]ASP95506.1 molybdopterin dehydrogenase [Sinorhizobium meliloti]MDE3814486.1 xanthine dehydrogenase family protein subunit M [Sinorhizobium meliloti]MQX57657.1 xanthine dehydrogenase family protein subunit M [Sinorhizobium meliloti]QGJ78653.1 xanthine dehydrogenase family protein subunit M [Sinorhizobium meliloti]QQF01757.1 xanthine dehydrogenase family protein subunit M [Sinorhizobium meliloti]
MKSFAYVRAADLEAAVQLLSKTPNAKLLGGGTNLVDLMRENIEQPDALVDVTGLPLDRIEERPDGGLVIGATVRNTAVAGHPVVRDRYPLLAQAIVFGASGQIRNMATVAGNLMQRTRCLYFYDHAARCNKRAPGAGCDAIGGFNRMHAILGASDSCIATHPSDMCVALAALDAKVNVVGPSGARSIAFEDFHRLPEDTPDIETDLRPGELITGVEIPPLGFARRSLYRKVRDRASYAFALVSVAAALEVDSGKVRNVRLALGGVAHKPWRAIEAERVLAGANAGGESFRQAAEAELAPARGLAHNAFKIELTKRTIVGVLGELAGG